MNASQLFSTVQDSAGKVWILADFRHHGAQYGCIKLPDNWRIHDMKYTLLASISQSI